VDTSSKVTVAVVDADISYPSGSFASIGEIIIPGACSNTNNEIVVDINPSAVSGFTTQSHQGSSKDSAAATGSFLADCRKIQNMLVENFDDCVVKYLDKVSREAYEKQEEIEDPRTFAMVKRAFEDRIMNVLIENTENKIVPPLDFFKKVVNTLANKYSYMFLKDPTTVIDGMRIRKFDQRGTGGVLGVEHLPKSLSQKYRRIVDKHNSGNSLIKQKSQEESRKRGKKGRLPQVYGVVQTKFFPTDKNEVNIEQFLDPVAGTEEREQVFASHRTTLQRLLTSSADIHSAIPGFFDEICHLQTQFEWLTNSSIVSTINKEVPRHLGMLKLVLEDLYPTEEFRLNAEIAKLKCGDHSGSKVPEYVFLLRELNMVWHKTRSGIIRSPEEPAPCSPHIVINDEVETYK
jgi:hypothetical protein